MAAASPGRAGVGSARRVLSRSSGTGRALRAMTPSVVIITILLAIQSGLGTVSPLMLQRVIDGTRPGASLVSAVVVPALLAAAAALASTAANVIEQRVTASTGQRFQERLRVLMLGKLTRLPSSAVGAEPSGAMLSRITNDTEQAQSFVSSILPQVFGLITRLVVLVTIMSSRSVTITLVVLGLGLVLILPTEGVSRRLAATTDRMLDAMSSFSGTVMERTGVAGHLFSRTVADTETDQQQARQTAAEVRRTYTRMITIETAFSSSLDLAGSLGTVAILVIGGHSVIRGEMTVGSLAALITLAPQLYEPLQSASGIRTALASTWAALVRVHGFLEKDEEWYEPPAEPVDVLDTGSLIVREVDFSVPSESGATTLLHSVSLTARCGEIVSVVGPSGSGKSTLLSLIAGANRPERGHITFGGLSPADTGSVGWNRIVQLCPQDPFFRSATLLENFTLARPGIREDQVDTLCRQMGLDLSRLGDRSGMTTMMGEHGMRVSGGERARLAIARMLALSPRVLLLDEPTSALDDESTRRFISVLLTLRRSHCVIVTTHDARLSTVTDRTYRMEDGRLSEVRPARASALAGAGDRLP
ncbi:ABC transporter ATP-binding protein [Actinomyces wuliandei]|uniref:ABC transporter ATP-binding protein n=1 Tax=Actinomyces wuliandei TaxID=2057743 RepID=UPI000FD6FD17|nr:ABC transporter ATP-binding protein [Actinomyces wuliandei]